MAMDRRSVLTGLVVGGAAGSVFSPMIWDTVYDIAKWSQNWPWIPRVPNYGNQEYKAALSKLDGSAAGVRVLTVSGKPVVVYGDPAHPLSKGGVSPLAACEMALHYSPSRLKQPMKKGAKGLTPISWDEALGLLTEKLKAAGSKVAAVSGDETGTAAELLAALVAKLGSKNFFFMPSDSVDAARAAGKMGLSGQIGYNIEDADFVLAVGADVLQSWGTYLATSAAFKAAKPVAAISQLGLAYCGPVKNHTAAVADVWVPLMPGMETAFLLALTAEVAKRTNAVLPEGLDALVKGQFGTKQMKDILGVSDEALADLAKRLSSASRPVVIAGSVAGQGGGEAAVMAAALLNSLVNGGMTAIPAAPAVAGVDRAALYAGDLMAFLKKPDAQVLLVHEANPAYALPGSGSKAELFKGIPFVVSFSSFLDETAAQADLVLPSSMSFERADDSYSPYGCGKAVYTLTDPVMKPVFDTKAPGEVVLLAAKKLGLSLGVDSFAAALKAKATALGGSGKAGVASADAPKVSGLKFPAMAFVAPKGKQAETVLALLNEVYVGSAKLAIPPHNTSVIPDDLLKGKAMFAHMCSATAAKLGVHAGGSVTLASAFGELKAKVAMDESVMPGVVAVPMGLGHTAWDNFSKNKGDNVSKILTVSAEPGTGASIWAASTVKIA